MSFLDKIVEPDEIDDNPNLLVYSWPGKGKTPFSATDDDVLSLNCEGKGLISVHSAIGKGNNFKQIKCPTWTDFITVVEDMEDYASKGKPFPFKWLVIDTLTTLQKRQLMRHILDEVHAKKSSRDLFIPDKPEYLRNQLMLVDVVKRINDLPISVLWLAHAMEVPRDGEVYTLPAIDGGLDKGGVVAQQVMGMMTSFGYMYHRQRTNEKGQKLVKDAVTKEPVMDFVIQWETYESKVETRDRTGVLRPETVNRTLKQIRIRMEKEAAKVKQEKEKANGTN